MQNCRRQTLQTIAGISAEVFRAQAHTDFSPVGWHLGHIAYTESLWIAKRQSKQQYERLFSADGLPKSQRQNLPDLTEILAYMAEVRVRTLRYLDSELPASADEPQRLWHWLIQHEAQHVEIITMVLALHQRQGKQTPLAPAIQQASPISSLSTEMLLIPAGDFYQGCNAPEAIDNERPVHKVSLERYWIDRAPVTCGQYRQFIQAGGYQTEKWWCEQGWEWQQRSQIARPLYWIEDVAFDDYPVMGVSWYEADAYARATGKRLPTESEWAKAAANEGCQPMLGDVWEWTDTWFAGYPGFRPFPYEGYSQLYFDGAHRVLRGGSWATPSWALRNSFRNWYHPHRQELFAGFRCAA